MNLQPTTQKYFGQVEFLRNSVGLEFKTAGGTIDATKFGDVAENGYIKSGTAVGMNAEGYYEPFSADASAGAGLVAHDIKLVEGSNAIIGVLLSGHPLEDKCTGVTEEFKTATAGYLRFDA